jgi:hypothetical protein
LAVVQSLSDSVDGNWETAVCGHLAGGCAGVGDHGVINAGCAPGSGWDGGLGELGDHREGFLDGLDIQLSNAWLRLAGVARGGRQDLAGGRFDGGVGDGHEGHIAAALEEDAEEAAGSAVRYLGDEKRGENLDDFVGDFFGRRVVEGAAEIAPAGEAGPVVAEEAGVRLLTGRSVMTAEFVFASGHAAAFFSGGQGEGTFGWHDFSELLVAGSWLLVSGGRLWRKRKGLIGRR